MGGTYEATISEPATSFDGWTAAYLLGFILFSIWSVSRALTEPISFDGSQTAQVARNLASKGLYATNYETYVLFDPKITTGAPVVLLAALFFKLFGTTFEAALMVNVLYLFLFALALSYYLVRSLELHKGIALLAVVLLWGTPWLASLGFGLLGEVPILFFLILMLIQLNNYQQTRKTIRLFWAGLFLGLAVLTKFIALIALPTLVFIIILDALLNKGEERPLLKFAKSLGLILVGLISPIIPYEIYQVITIGWESYSTRLQQRLDFISQHPGLKADAKITLWQKFSDHLGVLANYFNINQSLLLFLLFALFALFIFTFVLFVKKTSSKKKDPDLIDFTDYSFTALLTLTLSFFGWWLIITSLPWERYIFPGVILLEGLFCALIGVMLKASKFEPSQNKLFLKWAAALLIVILALYAGLSIYRSQSYQLSFENSAEKEGYVRAAQFINTDLAPDSNLLGYAWWEAPILSFAANKQFGDLLRHPELFTPGPITETYLVSDSFTNTLGKTGWQNLLDQFDYHRVYRDDQSQIVVDQLINRPLFAYSPFTTEEINQADYSEIVFSKGGSGVYARNVYFEETNPNGRWAQRTSAYLLRYAGESNLSIAFWLQDPERYSAYPMELDIYANHQIIAHQTFTDGGTHQISVVLPKLQTDTLELTLVCNAQYIYENPDRILSLFLNSIKLE
jgi:hypothetical protein